ncbi:thioesterase family protein [Nocardioidaceae bacterium]|nr:thioesterase family protein [Nocardioidaceae bacterium]
MSASAFYVPLGDDTFESTPATASPWDESLQHGGPPSALLAHAIEGVRSSDDLQVARFTANFLGGIPQGRVRVEASVVRPGRRVELVEATLWAGDRPAVTASAWLIRSTPGATAEHWRPDTAVPDIGPEGPERFFDGVSPTWGYGRAIDWRFVEGGYEPGPALVWTRLRIPLIEGTETSPLERLLVVADSTNGLSLTLPLAEWWAIPPTLMVSVERAPAGEWVLLDACSTIGPDGVGTASGTASDDRGVVARILQPLMVAPR